jgi:hypothetical protein
LEVSGRLGANPQDAGRGVGREVCHQPSPADALLGMVVSMCFFLSLLTCVACGQTNFLVSSSVLGRVVDL